MNQTALIAISAVILGLSGCSRDDGTALANSASATYNSRTKDNIVKNWQAKIGSAPRCQPFKDRFKASGDRYSGPNGAFMTDMAGIWEEAKTAACGSAA